MKIEGHKKLLTQSQIAILQNCAAQQFSFGKFRSLDDILTNLKVKVVVEPGVYYDEHLVQDLENTLSYWKNYAKEAELHETNRDEYLNAIENVSIISKEIEILRNLPLRGLYEASNKIIRLFPEEMACEYNGQRMNELLKSTLVHETMHAYFNRPRRGKMPYVYFVEEPLAEFGMLIYMKEKMPHDYQWAYNDVNGKQTCYRYGANLMNNYLKEGNPSPTRTYLEEYKIKLDAYTMPFMKGVWGPSNVKSSMPGNTQSSATINGISVYWKDAVYPPKYFWDEATGTLGLDGNYSNYESYLNDELCDELNEIIHRPSPMIKQVYLGDHFKMRDHTNILLELFSQVPVSVSLKNKNFAAINDIPVFKRANKPALSSCGNGYYQLFRNGKWGAIDGQMNTIVPLKYDSIWSFDSYGLCLVRKDESIGYRYGYVNIHGIEQIPVIYDHIYNFYKGVTTAKTNGRWFIIYTNNVIITELDEALVDVRHFRDDGYAKAKDKNGKWGAIDTTGKLVVPCIFNNITDVYPAEYLKNKDQ